MTQDAIFATLALGGMCLIMWWLARLARRRMGVGAGTVTPDGLRVVGKRPLDQRHALWVVEIAGGRHILLGSSLEGSVTKLDDITPEEYAAMSSDAVKTRAPKLRLARTDATGAVGAAGAAGDGAPAGTASDAHSDSASDPASEAHGEAGEGTPEEEPRFATVSESFTHFLGKAKDARNARRNDRASGE